MTDSTYMSPAPYLDLTINQTLDSILPKKRPLVALQMADEFYSPIITGKKRITIREGLRDYHPSEKVVLCNVEVEHGWAVMAKITNVRHCTLKKVSLADLNADGMATFDNAIEALRRFYQHIDENSLVTVIKWELL